MNSRDFCYWLQGFFEISTHDGKAGLSPTQTKTIKNHLDMVFVHEIDPSHGDAAHQAELAKAHEGKPQPKRSGKRSVAASGYQKPPRATC